jgi:hypothetical protein
MFVFRKVSIHIYDSRFIHILPKGFTTRRKVSICPGIRIRIVWLRSWVTNHLGKTVEESLLLSRKTKSQNRHTYHSRLIPKRVAETSQIFLRDTPTFYQNDLAMKNTADVTYLTWNADNPLVAFYDIHGRKREVLFFSFVPDTTRDTSEQLHNNITLTEFCDSSI